MDVNEAGEGRGRVPEIRIRKSSDAPSLSEVKQHSPAPLASFDALSDVESDTNATDTEEDTQTLDTVLSGYTQILEGDHDLDTPGLYSQGLDLDPAHTEPEETSTLENSPVSEEPPSPLAMDTTSELTTLTSAAENGDDSNSEMLGVDALPPHPPPPTPQFDRDGSGDNDDDKPSVNGGGADTAENFMSTFASDYNAINTDNYGDYATLNTDNQDDYATLNTDKPEEPVVMDNAGLDQEVEEAMELQSTDNDESYSEVSYEKPILEQDKPAESTYEKITIKLPGRAKSPKKPPPPKPAPPVIKNSWVDFGEDTEEEKKKPSPRRPPPPSRPPPPKATAPPRPALPRPASKGAKPDDRTQGLVDDASYDAEDDQSALTEKKKSRGLTPKKLKGLVTGKKDKKKDKKEKENEEFKKFTSSGPPPAKDSEQWQAFQQMLDRSKSAAVVTQLKISRLEDQFDEKLGDELSKPDPWTLTGAVPDPSVITTTAVTATTAASKSAGWVGFDDNFGAGDARLATLAVSPVPSPRHDPVPPNNSRRASVEGRDADLLGMANQSADIDLLGLDNQDDAGVAFPAMNPDIMALSRNQDEPKTSETSSPAHPGLDPFSTAEMDSGSGALDLVDEFLGISGQQLAAPRDPLEALLNKKEPEEPPQDAVGGFLGMTSKIEADDDDPFGLGAKPAVPATTAPVNMDLFIVEEGDQIPPPEPEVLPKEDEVFMIPKDIIAATKLPSGPSEEEEMPPPPPDLTMFPEEGSTLTPQPAEVLPLQPAAIITPQPAQQIITPQPAQQIITPQPAKQVITPSNDDFDFDPRAENITVSADIKPAQDVTVSESKARPRPRARPAAAAQPTNPFNLELVTHDTRPLSFGIDEAAASEPSSNPFASAVSSSAKNPFTVEVPVAASGASLIAFADDEDEDGLQDIGDNVTAAQAVAGTFNPFETINDPEKQSLSEVTTADAAQDESFNPFQTIHDDDAFEVQFTSQDQTEHSSDEAVSPARVNPFDKEPPLDEKFASFEPKNEPETKKSPGSQGTSTQVSTESEDEDLEPLPPYHPPFEGEGWKVLIRQPTKKKLAQNRFWKTVFIKILHMNKVPVIKVFANEQCKEQIHELPLQPAYQLCNLGLQTFDQFGKCHTFKVQYVFYRERVGVKAERITPTLSDLTRVRDFKSLKDLVHKPKATMILDHAPQASELLKFGGLDYMEFKSFIRELENTMFHMEAKRESKTLNYTKDEVTVDVVDEYFAAIDRDGHIVSHKARVRVFCLAFLTGSPFVEVGVNDRRRRGKEVVGRHDIIPIKTEEWIKLEDPEFHSVVDRDEYAKNKIIKFKPLDACQFELLRFRVRPRLNKELPLQVRAQMSIIDRHVEIRSDIMIPGYYSNSRRASQTPCEDIMIRFPIPDAWIYLFRVEKRFRYGSVKSTHRKPGKIKGLERLTMMAQGMLPPSLIEVSTGTAKYEHIFHSIIWRVNRLPERNEGAYKTHLFTLKLDLGPHDVLPAEYDNTCYVEYHMPNSTVSRGQIRSIAVAPIAEDNPDKWVHHTARYEYNVTMEVTDQPPKPPVPMATVPDVVETSGPEGEEGTTEGPAAETDSDSSDTDSD